jgi:hypothetical protein
MATVRIMEPADGTTVANPFRVAFDVSGMSVKPAGDMSPGTGHHNLLIDTDPIPAGQLTPVDEQHVHFGKAQTATTLQLPPGEHRLNLQFENGAHQSYGPELSHTITVTVR